MWQARRKQRLCQPFRLSYGLPFAGLIFYGARGYTPRELYNSIKIKGLAVGQTFGGRFDAVYFDPGRGPDAGLLRCDADRARPRRRPLRARDVAAAFA